MSTENQPPDSNSDQRRVLLSKAKNLATTPGVYLMKKGANQILYVGKAKSLRSRVISYFQPQVHDHPKTELLVQWIEDFEVIHTETEDEALVLECTLIKRYKPKFNIRLKDDKHYPYIKIPLTVDFPRLEWTRQVSQDSARYFGPFPSSFAARTVMRLLTESFQLRDCSDNTFSHRSRACILYQMDQCSAPCVGKISLDDYQERIRQATMVLEGKGEAFIQELEQSMKRAADEERYEDAARIRDQIQSIQVVSKTQSVVDADTRSDTDVFAVVRNENHAHGVVLQVRGGKLLSLKHYDVQNYDASLEDAQIFEELLAQHVLIMGNKSEITQAQNILVESVTPAMSEMEQALGVTIHGPDSEVQKQLILVANTNAKYALENAKRAAESGHSVAALEEVQSKLGMDRIPRRIECFDISNTQGEESVASRVVFVDGAPEKSLYRKYKIKTVIGANDFASMREVFDRRFSQMDARTGDEKPDLVIVDGGKGQLAQAKAIFDELQIQGVSLVGLAKARTEKDFQAKEVESSLERVFIPNRANPISLYPTTDAYKLLTHVRDEAHRFAIQYHRSLRHKRSMGK